MARFYGTVQGARGEASRLGDSVSGLRVEACSWRGKVVVGLHAHDVVDYVTINAAQHGSSSNPTGDIFEGTFEELGQLIQWWRRRDEINAVIALMAKQSS
jgi:hypothetical protein